MDVSKFSKEIIDTKINLHASSPNARRCLMDPMLVSLHELAARISLHLPSERGDNANIRASLQKCGSKVVMEHLYSLLLTASAIIILEDNQPSLIYSQLRAYHIKISFQKYFLQ